ncbi:MAG: Hybrid signal transduction histidine kinase and diguanylatecyclase/phosphodiesterase [Candidatus Moranbacteria bacterium GW2011_GWE1_35_17]|nr:MAG: Hybrid signal transduction histidine kinase and diguanylatecyclase/phosphodiesterase [Candidatus Moranbacteria bacterium GW2011_GWE1_35_17]KKP72998.1 MAG: Hybrid signal transduction histidine kinase and diguanylatecyclase/phosphodiesterase [Candidatus Moranbacteria bacterium GW2011_GWE2_35_164]KKP83324.1 MAG: Hybrid signal transduction histidine kinase and diguanylatecyclase/phosphodiesterase [Candidatus Moranbacteria bacterium GW2011_GWF1_35_5]KKP84718.1 MAG: Hybrid signal transduction 
MEQIQNKKILMIEDEDVFIDMFGGKLAQDGYDMTFAKNGAWGIREALENKFDLIMIDMVMPAMGGEEIINKLKLEESTKDTPIVVLSASVDDETKEKIEQMGITAFFVKTHIIPSELSQKIKEILF